MDDVLCIEKNIVKDFFFRQIHAFPLLSHRYCENVEFLVWMFSGIDTI